MSNQAKDWQEGTYVINVSKNTVKVTHNYYGLNEFCVEAQAKCDPEDEFSLSMGVALAMDKLSKKLGKELSNDKIEVGDIVKIKNQGVIYSSYNDWVSKQVIDGLNPDYATRYRYDDYESDTDCEYTVIKIAPHLITPDLKLALIESSTPMEYCYVIDVEGLEKC